MGEFPGQFKEGELIRKDYRDLMFWAREARLKSVREEIRELSRMRTAFHADSDGFSRIISNLENRIRLIEAGKTDVEIDKLKQQDAWDDLEFIAGG